MLWIIISVALVILIIVAAIVTDRLDMYNAATRLWAIALPIAIFGGIFGSFGLNVYFDLHDRIPEDRYTTLYSMNDAIGAKGQFFLGSGTIDAAPVYTYYWQDGDRFRLAYVYSSSAYIVYSDETPVLIHHGSRQRYSNWFSIGADDWSVNKHDGEDPYEFRVPKGSIMQQFNLDAQ